MADESEQDFKDLEKRAKILQEAYNEYRTLESLKDELISNVSHELRTPLTICKSVIDLAMNEGTEEERNKLLTMGKEALDRQNRIIGDLVGSSNIQKGIFELNIESVDLGQLIIISKKEIEPLAVKRGINIKTTIQKDLPEIGADIDKLKHALFDLLNNAIKFNKKGGEVLIEAKQDGNKVEVSISDTGVGIPEEHLDKIFDRFYQVDSSTSRKYGGVGLGLAIVRDVIERHDGKMWVESKVGKGSKFVLVLPIYNPMASGRIVRLPEEFRKRFPSLLETANDKKK